MAKIFEGYEDLILWLLYVPGETGKIGEPIFGRTRLVKTVFLFEKEVKPIFNKDLTEKDTFDALHFGPFDAKVYTTLNFLAGLNMIKFTKTAKDEKAEEEVLLFEERPDEPSVEVLNEFDGKVEKFEIAELGKKFITENHAGKLTENQIQLLSKLKEKINSASLRSLLQYVYSKYPETTTKSIIKDSISN